VVASLTAEERLAIAEAVRDEIRPLRREIAAYREKNDLQTVLGGIGYIMGLFGLYFYIAARRRMQR
jgi:nickel transport protein